MTTPPRNLTRVHGKDSSPLTHIESIEASYSEKSHDTLSQRINFDGAFTIVAWNVKSAAKWVKSKDHKEIISYVHAHLKADIFCIQESLWVSKSFCQHTMTESNTDKFRCVGNKEASILYNHETVQVEDVSREIPLDQDHFFLRGRFVTAHVKLLAPPSPEFLLVSLHMPYKVLAPSRLTNAEYLTRTLRTYAIRQSLPLVFCGDFNFNFYNEYNYRDPRHEGITLLDHRDENPVDGFGYFGSTITAHRTDFSWSDICDLKPWLIKKLASYRLGGSHVPMEFIVTVNISRDSSIVIAK
jgi:exonuclease III